MNTQLNEVNEIWADINGYEGFYQVSTSGRVRSLDRLIKFGKVNIVKPGRILQPRALKVGYLRVHLAIDGVIKEHYIHRLVAEAFIDNPDNKPEINHLDENKDNNDVRNLVWSTRIENVHWSMKANRQLRQLATMTFSYTDIS